uniref:Uncharacterized protein n=1 Tax=Arundo donax TaxID=35708 RepID=A0A0A8ZNZ3_ARUDO
MHIVCAFLLLADLVRVKHSVIGVVAEISVGDFEWMFNCCPACVRK